jgi:hypothetical protein
VTYGASVVSCLVEGDRRITWPDLASDCSLFDLSLLSLVSLFQLILKKNRFSPLKVGELPDKCYLQIYFDGK